MRTFFADEAISGATDNRVGLQRLLALAQQQPPAFDVILVDDTSRLSRMLIDSLKIFERLQFSGVRVIFVSQGIDTSSEQAELLVVTHGIVNSLYLRTWQRERFAGSGKGLSMDCTPAGEFLATVTYPSRAVTNETRTDAH